MSQPSPQYETARSEMQEAIEHHRATKARERQLSHDLMEHRLWLHRLNKAADDEEPALFADQIKQLTHRDGRTYGGDGS